MLILGLDPGFAITGYGLVDSVSNHLSMVKYGAITTPAGMPFTQRLLAIRNELNDIIREYKPEAAAIEELFFNSNTTTAIKVAQGRGVAVETLAENSVPVFEYTPLQVKMTVVGYGRAEKNQIQQMVKMMLKLDKIPKPDDAADALAIAVCHSFSRLTAKPV